MKAVTLNADWVPKPDFKLGSKDVDGKLTYLGSKVWKNLWYLFSISSYVYCTNDCKCRKFI